MPVPPTSGRLQWTDVPTALRARLEDALGAPVTDTVTPGGGFGHQLAAALRLADGRRAFVKAAPDDDPLTAANVHEAAVLDALPPGAPAPKLLGIHHAANWTAVVIAHLDGPHPDLSPASGDAGQTWALLDKLTSSPAPAPYAKAVSTTPSTAAGLHGWDELLRDPPADLAPAARDRLPQLAELEAAWPALARGNRIVHGDLRADNMVRDRHLGVTFVDWAHATTGPACIDAASLAPQLVLAGHAPADIARLLCDHPATATNPDATTAFLTALTGHWHRNARKPAPPAPPDCAPTSTAPPPRASPSSATA
ncbi:phosphotransferase (plasmid) [Streptomyces sp. NBC_01591]|uniref:phosphotransferase family protein n=1 Tax=Streptomyces sp. NBC_01591 TaxID=2975888 RepID=UPI002DD8FC26|nr:phosphotransferase [Streptomyces sp. NBC_01591]WSD66116.1 phosphotransferase [Streptomyces sp. NBC_01591]WSD73001.1 phosphotransferase [Streptomyces sp. NBC_01591]WSD74490.1 phosphotransferase [Streptomyces sp. NBC_01591]